MSIDLHGDSLPRLSFATWRHVGRPLVARRQRFEQRPDRLAECLREGFEQINGRVLGTALDPANVARLASCREAKRLLREAMGDP